MFIGCRKLFGCKCLEKQKSLQFSAISDKWHIFVAQLWNHYKELMPQDIPFFLYLFILLCFEQSLSYYNKVDIFGPYS